MSEKTKYLTELRESATFDRSTMAEIRRAADTGIYDIRGWGPNASYRILMTCYSWGRACHVTRWKAIVKNVIPR